MRRSTSVLATPATSTALTIMTVLAGSAVLALSAKLQVPFWPVPMTMQTLAVLLLGAGLGSRVGVACVLAYLAEGLAGLPVFAGAVAGPAYMAGPTGGYLLGFVLAAWATGWLVERGHADTLPRAFAAMLLAHALLFVPGVLWLAHAVGGSRAIAAGLTPFLLGTAVKSGIAAALLRAVQPRFRAG